MWSNVHVLLVKQFSDHTKIVITSDNHLKKEHCADFESKLEIFQELDILKHVLGYLILMLNHA